MRKIGARTFGRFTLLLFAIGALAGCTANSVGRIPPAVSAGSGDTAPNQHTFKYTGAEQPFKVPAGVTMLTIVAGGAAGAGESGSYRGYYEYF
jgi:hypothetical protein